MFYGLCLNQSIFFVTQSLSWCPSKAGEEKLLNPQHVYPQHSSRIADAFGFQIPSLVHEIHRSLHQIVMQPASCALLCNLIYFRKSFWEQHVLRLLVHSSLTCHSRGYYVILKCDSDPACTIPTPKIWRSYEEFSHHHFYYSHLYFTYLLINSTH